MLSRAMSLRDTSASTSRVWTRSCSESSSRARASNSLPEPLQVGHFNSQPCCVLVASEPFEKRFEFLQRIVKIESRDAPSGTHCDSVFHAQDEHRPSVFFQQFGGHDAKDSPVPPGSRYHQSPLRSEVLHGGKRRLDLVQDLPLKALAFAVLSCRAAARPLWRAWGHGW